MKNDPFCPCEKDEELFGLEVPYLIAISALMYLSNCTCPNITFFVYLLARYNFTPTWRHWNGIKRILCYLCKTIDIGLFYLRESTLQ